MNHNTLNITNRQLDAQAYRQWRTDYQDRTPFACVIVNLVFSLMLAGAAYYFVSLIR